jgi:hypothetical protein
MMDLLQRMQELLAMNYTVLQKFYLSRKVMHVAL